MSKSDVEKILSGDIVSLSRFIRDVDDSHPDSEKTLKEIFKYSGNSQILGVTGLPGAGKSSLITHLITHYRKQEKSVGVIAVDPTSPFSGGAILGDRIRMKDHNSDPEVFIKSVATRGAFGGLSKSVVDIVHILEAAKKDVIIIETVGVGQDEVDIVRVAGEVLVVTAPGLGDDIQAIKAGILEIADIFVVNKMDLVGADKTALELREAAEDKVTGKLKPIMLTDSIREEGLKELFKNVEQGFEKYTDKNLKNEYLKRRFKFEIEVKVRDRLMDVVRDKIENDANFDNILTDIGKGKKDLYSVVEDILGDII